MNHLIAVAVCCSVDDRVFKRVFRQDDDELPESTCSDAFGDGLESNLYWITIYHNCIFCMPL